MPNKSKSCKTLLSDYSVSRLSTGSKGKSLNDSNDSSEVKAQLESN